MGRNKDTIATDQELYVMGISHQASSEAPCQSDIDKVGAQYTYWRRRNRFYYQELARLIRRHVKPGARVLELGCEGGDLLAELKPAFGVGVDPDPAIIEFARQRHPELAFYTGGLEQLPCDEKFDAVVICNAVGKMRDVQAVFAAIKPFCSPQTRVIVSYYNALWEPVLELGSRVGIRRKIEGQNWLSRDDLANLFELTGFQVIREFGEILMPKPFPLLDRLMNRFLVKFWPFKHFGLANVLVARSVGRPLDRDTTTVSVIVPTRDERGNVEPVIQRTPIMGAKTELIFVDGWSTDGTPEEIERCIEKYSNDERPIRFIRQEGKKGKGQAVRQGFAAATGDILMILDADMTVAPEDLPKFFDALVDGLGEFINGTRLVYPMENEAMRFLNKCGNRFFSALFTWLIGQRFRDTLCGTKVLIKPNYERIAAGRADLGEFDPFGDFDLIFGAARCDLKIIEIPVRYGARTYGETSISRFRDVWLLLGMSWKAFWKLRLR